jgi:nucleotide-binding universal stress UspA family protein
MALSIKRIVVGTDFSDAAEHALDYAIELAKKLGGEIVLVHAYELPTYAFPEGAVIHAELVDRIGKVSEDALNSAVRERAKSGVPIKPAIRTGNAWREVLAVAEEEKADLVVIGTHGRRGIARVIMGSVAERVVRMATCPVLTVRPPHT